MARFEHLGGGLHAHSDGKNYKKGDVISSGIDLERQFPGKFRRLDSASDPSNYRTDFPSPSHLGASPSEFPAAPPPPPPMTTAPGLANPPHTTSSGATPGAVNPPTAKKISIKAKGVTAKDARGDDVTDDFEDEIESGFEVFERDGQFHVFEKGKTDPINPKGIKKTEVKGTVKKFLEE